MPLLWAGVATWPAAVEVTILTISSNINNSSSSISSITWDHHRECRIHAGQRPARRRIRLLSRKRSSSRNNTRIKPEEEEEV